MPDGDLTRFPDGRRRLLVDGYYVDWKRGIGRYVRELLYGLHQFAPGVELHVAAPSGAARFAAAIPNACVHELPHWPFPAWEQLVFPRFARRLGPHIVHAPYNTFPLQSLGGARLVVTVHDLMFLDPNFRPMGQRQRLGRMYRSFIVQQARRRTLQVTTMTQQVAGEIDARLGIRAPIHRTSVSHFVDGARAPVAGLPDRYMLHVGGAAHHKNTPATVAAFLRGAPQDVALVVAGIAADHPIATRWRSERVLFPGWISDGQLLSLYDGAEAVLFPSLMEGYGLPVLEAMACGTPVVTSNRAPMSELAGGAALLVDPEDPDALASAIQRIGQDGRLRTRLACLGRRRANDFTAARMADALRAIYAGGET